MAEPNPGSGTTSPAPSSSSADAPSESCQTSTTQTGSDHIQWTYRHCLASYKLKWLNPPRIEDIRTVLEPFLNELGLGSDPRIEFLSEGVFHKVFQVSRKIIPQQLGPDVPQLSACPSYVFRAAIPDYPFYKTASEVATMTYVRQHTTIPVPRAYAYDTSSDNALGHEWILMEMIKGASMYNDIENDMSMEQKVELSRQVADWVHELGQIRFSSIGSLYFLADLEKSSEDLPESEDAASQVSARVKGRGPVLIDPKCSTICLGPAVHQALTGDWRPDYDFNRGPYSSVAAFIDSLLDMHNLEINDDRQRARAAMGEAVDQVYGICDEQERAAQLALTMSDWTEMTEARLGGPLGSRVIWGQDSPYRTDKDLDIEEFVDATEAHSHFKRALQQTEFDFIRQDLTAGLPCCRLFPWDMSFYNVLIDNETKEPVSVIDWEQVVLLPPYLVDFYPSVLHGYEPDEKNDDIQKPSFGPDDDEDYMRERMTSYEAKLLRGEFRDRLYSLDPTYQDMYEARRSEYSPDQEEEEWSGFAKEAENKEVSEQKWEAWSSEPPESDKEAECKEPTWNPESPESLELASTTEEAEKKEEAEHKWEAWSSQPPESSDQTESPEATESGDLFSCFWDTDNSHSASIASNKSLCLRLLNNESPTGQEEERRRAAETAIRHTINGLRRPMHNAWEEVEDLYEDLGYVVSGDESSEPSEESEDTD